MRSFLITMLSLIIISARSQNVGIGTASPTSKLHIAGTDGGSANLSVTAENPADTASSSFRLVNGGATADFSRYGANATGTVLNYGISTANLVRLFNSGPILVAASSQLYFGTNNGIRLRFDELGRGSINTIVSPTVQLNIASVLRDAVYVVNNAVGATQAHGINARIYNEVGAALVGITKPNFEPYSAYEAGSYGILGLAGYTGIAGGFFALNGTAIRTTSDSGLSINSTGKLRFAGVGEGAGKVLTSDTAGNATWQPLPSTTAFVHTATAGNTSGNATTLSYANAAATDILIVTPNFNPNGAGVYNKSPIGVSWTGSAWTIFNQTVATNILAGAAFNVMVVRQ